MYKKEGIWDLGDEEFTLFARFIEEHSGIYFDEHKKDSLRISLTTRTSLNRLKTFVEYFQLLNDRIRGPEEFKKLLSLITINETSFFRNPAQFAVLKNHAVPAIIAKKSGNGQSDRTIRIWSAGCSTGEEPYSIAMAMRELGYLLSGWKVEILATDVSEKALAAAEKGEYSRRSLANLTHRQVDQSFVQHGDRYTIMDEVKEMVRFGYFNLIRIPYPLYQVRGMDIIFCRNVTIYFKTESTRRVINNFYDTLNDCGYLFIGHSETLWGISDRFQPIEKNGGFFYLKEGKDKGCSLPPPSSIREKKKERPSWPDPAIGGSAATGAASFESMPVTDLYAQCELLYQDGRYDEARSCLAGILMDNPGHIKARMLTASICANQEDYAGAERECLEAINIEPESADAYLLLGTISAKLRRREDALVALKKAVYFNPYLVEAYIQMATVHREMGQWEAAMHAFENAVKYLEGTGTSIVGGPGREVSHKILLDLCRGNIETLRIRIEKSV